jgi:tetratricopeptide (TPR) repeat protein
MGVSFAFRVLRRLLTAMAAVSLCIGLVSAQAAAPATPPAGTAPGQAPAKADPQREHALELYRSGKFVEAMPLLETFAADHPTDAVIKEAWSYSVMAYAATLPDPELRKKARVRARSIAVQAQELGDRSNLLQIILETPVDGGEPVFSNRKDVDDAMKAAEADYVRGEFEKAREGYLRALLLDPKNYEAALFMGDVYFKEHVNGSAGEWFTRAIEIDPNRETAYRYWGDALWNSGKSGEAREKYIQAIIAEPYNNRSWIGLNQWAQRTKTTLNWIRLQNKSLTTTDGTKTTITVDPSATKQGDPALGGWIFYGGTRALWQREKFLKEFPDEKIYRHSLAEEAEALHSMVAILALPENSSKLDASSAGLVKVDQAGFIEPFALLNRADKEIAQDYAPYRAAHRNTIYRYFDEFVVPKAPPQ